MNKQLSDARPCDMLIKKKKASLIFSGFLFWLVDFCKVIGPANIY